MIAYIQRNQQFWLILYMLWKRLKEIIFGVRVKGEKIDKPTFKTTDLNNRPATQNEWNLYIHNINQKIRQNGRTF